MGWTIEKIMKTCNEIKGKKIKEIIPLSDILSFKETNKGHVGQLIEKNIFKLTSGNRSIPDFEELEIELKCTPLKKTTRKQDNCIVYIPKERVSLSHINFKTIINEINFYESDLYHKCETILFIFYLHDEKIEESMIIDFYLYNLNEDKNIDTIERDYYTIIEKIKSGIAETISESDTQLLGASTTGQGYGKDLRDQPYSKKKARARRFSFKKLQISNILSLLDRNEINSLIQYMKSKLEPHYNQDINNIIAEKNIKCVGKSIKNKVICKLLQVENYTRLINQFNLKKVMLKNVEYRKGKIKEKIGLINVDFEEFKDNINFEESSFYNFIYDLNIIFIVWETKNNITFLRGIKLYKIPQTYLEHARMVWTKTKELFLSSNCIKNIKDNFYEYNFTKIKDNKTFHVRPHDIRRNNTIKMPNGQYICRFQYWLNDIDLYFDK